MLRRILESIGFVGVLVALAVCVATYYMAGVDPKLEAMNNELVGEISRLESRAELMGARIRTLRVEVDRLRAGDAEHVHQARANLGMIRGGERVYQFEVGPEGEAPRK